MKVSLMILVVIFGLLNLFAPSGNAMGICFGGGYPQCCAYGKNDCGPLCASCSRVGEFLSNMRMFMGSMGTPSVFRIINPDPHVASHGGINNAVPTNFAP